MKKYFISSFTFFLFLSSSISNVYSQTIDSIIVTPQLPTSEDSIIIGIFGKIANTGIKMTYYDYLVDNNNINIQLFFNQCANYPVITPFDTTINVGILASGNYILNCTTIIDTLLFDTLNCWSDYALPEIIDVFTIDLSVASIENHSSLQFVVFPNPVNNLLYIEMKNDYKVDFIALYNTNGNILYIKTPDIINNNCIKIDMSKYEKGIYLLKIFHNNKSVNIKLFKV